MRTTEGRRRGLSAVLLVLGLVVAACGDSGTTAPPLGGARPVATVSVDPTALALVVGDSVRLQVVLKDAEGRVLTGRAVQWLSDALTTVTVTPDGYVRAIAPGVAHVEASSEGKRSAAAITVQPRPLAPVDRVDVTPTTLQLFEGESKTLTAVARDAANEVLQGRAIDWSSGDTTLAVVDVAGRVTGKRAGTVAISATSDGIVATASVTVRSAPTADLLYQRSVPDTNELYIRSFAAPGGPSTRINAGTVSHMPAASPNGARIAFAVHMVGLQGEVIDDIFAVDRNGMNMRRLTTMPGWEEHPAWSPDGTTIAFTHWDMATGREDIWVMNADGSGQRNLTAGEPTVQQRGEPSWSPDGQWLAYSATLGTAAPDRGNIWIMRADGSETRLLTSSAGWDRHPTWSPDGTRIAFARAGDVAIVGVATGLVTSLGLAQAPWYPSWSPDGEFIAFAARPADNVFGSFSIYTVRADGSDVRLRVRDSSSTFASVVWPSWIRRQPAVPAAGR